MTDRLSIDEALQKFISTRCELGRDFSEVTNSLYSAYWAWCDLTEQPRMKRKKFPDALADLRLRVSSMDSRMTAGVRLTRSG